MLIGALLILTWLVLLVRYPLRAVPISLGAVLGLALVAGWVLWQEHREEQLLSRLEIRLTHGPQRCPGAQPLHVQLVNHTDRKLQSLQWEVAAYSPGSR
ncbi:MAG TPA: multidrug transporter, partial [Pseudomonas sp.]|nr:multidrug transporter [Pseudomonas sp.]